MKGSLTEQGDGCIGQLPGFWDRVLDISNLKEEMIHLADSFRGVSPQSAGPKEGTSRRNNAVMQSSLIHRGQGADQGNSSTVEEARATSKL